MINFMLHIFFHDKKRLKKKMASTNDVNPHFSKKTSSAPALSLSW